MNYICIFTLIFLGLLGSVSCVAALCEAITYNTEKYPPTVVRYCGVTRLESRVRALLKSTKGDIIVLLPKASTNDEYVFIARKLAEENARVIIKQRKNYIPKKRSC